MTSKQNKIRHLKEKIDDPGITDNWQELQLPVTNEYVQENWKKGGWNK